MIYYYFRFISVSILYTFEKRPSGRRNEARETAWAVSLEEPLRGSSYMIKSGRSAAETEARKTAEPFSWKNHSVILLNE